MKFEWDDAKASANLEKHGVTFEEAISAFGDPFLIIFADPDHSIDELRFLLLGVSDALRLLVVSYTDRESYIRIISAREATRPERKNYEEEL